MELLQNLSGFNSAKGISVEWTPAGGRPHWNPAVRYHSLRNGIGMYGNPVSVLPENSFSSPHFPSMAVRSHTNRCTEHMFSGFPF